MSLLFGSIMFGFAEERGQDLIIGNGSYRRLFLDALTIEKQENLERFFINVRSSFSGFVCNWAVRWETKIDLQN